MASMPQPLHLMPVSVPCRARSKKFWRVTPGSVTAEQAHEDGRGVAAQGVGEAGPGTFHLAPPGFTTQLRDDLGDLRGTRGTDRVALGLEPARRVHRHLAAQARLALLRRDAARAGLEQPEALGGDDLGDREAV